MIPQFVIAHDRNDGKQPPVFGPGQLVPVVQPLLPVGGVGPVAGAEVAVKDDEQRPQLGHDRGGPTAGFQGFADAFGVGAADESEGFGRIRGRAEPVALAQAFAVLDHEIILGVRRQPGQPDELVVHVVVAAGPVRRLGMGVGVGVRSHVFGTVMQHGVLAPNLIPGHRGGGGGIVVPDQAEPGRGGRLLPTDVPDGQQRRQFFFPVKGFHGASPCPAEDESHGVARLPAGSVDDLLDDARQVRRPLIRAGFVLGLPDREIGPNRRGEGPVAGRNGVGVRGEGAGAVRVDAVDGDAERILVFVGLVAGELDVGGHDPCAFGDVHLLEPDADDLLLLVVVPRFFIPQFQIGTPLIHAAVGNIFLHVVR